MSILTILGIVSGLILSVFFYAEVNHLIRDFRAIKGAKKYCKRKKLIFEGITPLPNYYALYFRKDGKNYYVTFTYKNRRIRWISDPPKEKVLLNEVAGST